MKLNLKIPDIRVTEKLEKETNHFAKGLNFYKLFWLFFIGCFLGVVVETFWCVFTRHHFESRTGLIYGPFNLVYGFGALAMALGLHKLRHKRDFYILVGGILIGSVVEYVCSYVQEFMFGSVSWDYSTFPFNISGRINLLYSIFWGILAIVWIKFIYPLLARMIVKIPNKIGKTLTWVLLVFMIVNTVMSSLAVERWTMRIEKNTLKSNKIWEYFDKYYPDKRMEKIYPNMVITNLKPNLMLTE